MQHYGHTIETPIEELDEDALTSIINGESEPLRITAQSGAQNSYMTQWEGVVAYIEQQMEEGERGVKWKEQFIEKRPCSLCGGSRLKQESLSFKIDGKNIAELSAMSIDELWQWSKEVESRMERNQAAIAMEPMKEIRERLSFLVDVGLGYLSLSRSSRTLSGGESQRIRLATQIGSKLVNVLYILDEPSIGLHQRDNVKLINSLRALRDAGNTVIVVEHDEQMIRSGDYVVDVGPLAGRRGGEISAAGTLDEVMKVETITTDYLTGRRKIEIPTSRRKGNGQFLTLKGAAGNNLKGISVKLPLGTFICVTGVSGSGKSSLINGTLKPILSRYLYKSFDQPLLYKSIDGLELIDKMVVVDQSPIGRTPRSNPATYSNVM
ncbi:MAG: excinuclease ABC subunit UvrA, partial [Mucinivorans sp.]